MKTILECSVCHRRGNGEWAGWHKEHIEHNDFTFYGEDEKPPSKTYKDSIKLCIPGSRDLYSAIFGCQPLLAGCNCFRSLAWSSYDRRMGVLETNTKD